MRVATLFLSSALVLVAGCAAVQPRPLAMEEVQSQARADRQQAAVGVAPIRGAVSLEEAVARALKYNLDRRVKMMEEALARSQVDLSNYDMLPKAVLAAGYNHRSEFPTTRAIDSVTGAPSLANPSISSDRNHRTMDLGFSWSILDFGLSYYNARQNADRALVAAERRRRAMHQLIQDVRTAFWRAASAQKLREDVRSAIALAEDALGDARKAEAERVRAPLESLRYQRQVLENVRLLEAIDQDLATARVELLHLMNAPLALDLQVTEPGDALDRALLQQGVAQMEETAVLNNADLREQFYGAEIARLEGRKILLRMFPNLSLGVDLKYDDDRFLVHHRWNEAAAQLSFSLINLLSAPAQQRFADAGVAVADQRRIATQMAVLAQVHIARLQYAAAYQQFQRADAIWSVDDRINRIVLAGERAQTQSKLDRVSSNTTTILSMLRRYQALALAHSAASKLQATLGIEPQIPGVQEASLEDLTRVARDFLRQTQGEKP
ncbi:MAG TPA: TolC family protein [Ramlibacter sp.]|uniref:TolC family protein n=1 Tax=Ramlibacter sp. TaxID=1917967 RepID=UPI002ED59FB8